MSHLHSKPLGFLLFLSPYLLLLHSALGDDNPISLAPLYSDCSGEAYTNRSAFQTNLNTLFSSLNSKSPTSKFYNDTAGSTGIDRVYGLFLCEGDLSNTDCQACINAATTDILKACYFQRRAIIYYDYCQLRYSDQDFFGIMDPYNGYPTNNNDSVSDPKRPLDFVSNLIEEAPHQKPLMFAANASSEDGLFAMAECTMDITSADCAKCLNIIFEDIKSCCSTKQGWRYLSPSCSIRYEAVNFLRSPRFPSSGVVKSQCSDNKLSGAGISQQDVRNALSYLLSRPSTAFRGFWNTSVSVDGNSLYGLALCRADLDPESIACKNCLQDASSLALYNCPDRTQAIVWEEGCLLRYSNRDFFGAVSNDKEVLCNPATISEAENAAVIQMMWSLADKAPESQGMYAANITGNSTAYGLVQCTRDLSIEGCKYCLREAMGNATETCNQRKGWRYWSGSCTARYESTQFFDPSILLNAPAPAGTGNVDSSPTVKSRGSVCVPNFVTLALLCLLVINSMDGLGQLWEGDLSNLVR